VRAGNVSRGGTTSRAGADHTAAGRRR